MRTGPKIVTLICVLGSSALLPAHVSASCAGPTTQGQALAMADVAFEGIAVADPAYPEQMLTDPMRFQVRKYLKGAGPGVLLVYGGPERLGPNSFGAQSTMIEPYPTQRWTIYGTVDGGRIRTSECAGSRPVVDAADQPPKSSNSGSWSLAAAAMGGVAVTMGAGLLMGRRIRMRSAT